MTTVLTYGTFDLFHIGHLRLIEGEADDMGRARRRPEHDQAAGRLLGALEVAGEDRGGSGRVCVDQEHGSVPVEG